jgi:hypothetical protein
MQGRIKPSLAAVILALATTLAVAGTASAQAMPTPLTQEVLIKASLLTLNDAIVTDNFTVLHARMSKPFRDQFPPDRLRGIFKSFVDGHADFDLIVAKAPIAVGESKIDAEGVLRLSGYFDTTPKKLNYDLGYIRSEGDWKLSKLNVDIK